MSLEAMAAALVAAAMITGLKTSRRATLRCRNRRRRAMKLLQSGALPINAPFDAAAVRDAAADMLTGGCSNCRRCPGVTTPSQAVDQGAFPAP